MPTQPLQDDADRRTQLAADRTIFAAERTYSAWARTGLAALASGVGSKKLLEGVIPEWGIWAVGTVLVLFSAFCFGSRRSGARCSPDRHRPTPTRRGSRRRSWWWSMASWSSWR
jgi:hypothetical protein